jgi:hypothetical protein
MLNFKELKLDKRTDPNNIDPFVGIRRNENGEPEFRLPIGFDNFPKGDFNATKQLFFRMYRTFKKFEQDNRKRFQDGNPKRMDNLEVGGNAYQFKDKEDKEVILYSKISVIENMLKAYQDLALDIIERRIGRNEDIDFSKIDCYLHKAIYLPDGVIYLEEMDLARQTLQHESANIIELFCFILSELQQELEETIDRRVNELANKFREQHLTHDQSLFHEETFEVTIFSLKGILDDIDKTTAYKDDDYWQLYEAIETFLYGELDMENTHEEGIFWGIDKFWPIWEDMCNTYAFKKFDIVYADTNIVVNGRRVTNRSFGGHQVFCKDGFENPFFIEFRGERRWMRPDLVHAVGNNHAVFGRDKDIDVVEEKTRYSGIVNVEVVLLNKKSKDIYDGFLSNLKQAMKNRRKGGIKIRATAYNKFQNYPSELLKQQKKAIENIREQRVKLFFILDWKYHDYDSFISDDKKIQQDIIKQLSYEFALLQNYPDYSIESQFVIPCFYKANYKFEKDEDDIGGFIEDDLLIDRLRNNGIRIFQANFIKLQQIYLSES